MVSLGDNKWIEGSSDTVHEAIANSFKKAFENKQHCGFDKIFVSPNSKESEQFPSTIKVTDPSSQTSMASPTSPAGNV